MCGEKERKKKKKERKKEKRKKERKKEKKRKKERKKERKKKERKKERKGRKKVGAEVVYTQAVCTQAFSTRRPPLPLVVDTRVGAEPHRRGRLLLS